MFHVLSKGVKNKKGQAEKLSFDNLYHVFTLTLLVLIVENKNQNLPPECKKLSFPPRFSLFRALRYALVGVGKKKKQTFWQCISLK